MPIKFEKKMEFWVNNFYSRFKNLYTFSAIKKSMGLSISRWYSTSCSCWCFRRWRWWCIVAKSKADARFKHYSKKSLHITCTLAEHAAFKKVLLDYGLSMQEVLYQCLIRITGMDFTQDWRPTKIVGRPLKKSIVLNIAQAKCLEKVMCK